MANPYGGYPYGAGYAGYAQPGAPTYPPQVSSGAAAACAVCHAATLLSAWQTAQQQFGCHA